MARSRKNLNDANTKVTAAPKTPKKLRVEKKDVVIQPIQYAVLNDYVLRAKPGTVKIPEGRYGAAEGSSQREKINGAHVYRVEDGTAMIQFPCGDYLCASIDNLIELLNAVKELDITKAPRSRRGY